MPTRSRPKPKPSMLKPSKEPSKGKGKGKATQWDSDEDEDDDAYVTSNDFGGTPERPTRIPKPVERFGVVGGDDEEELYGRA